GWLAPPRSSPRPQPKHVYSWVSGSVFLLVLRVTITRPTRHHRRHSIRPSPTTRLPARTRRRRLRRRPGIRLRRQRRPRQSPTPHGGPGPTPPAGSAANTKRPATYRDAQRKSTGQPAAIQTASGASSIERIPDAAPADRAEIRTQPPGYGKSMRGGRVGILLIT